MCIERFIGVMLLSAALMAGTVTAASQESTEPYLTADIISPAFAGEDTELSPEPDDTGPAQDGGDIDDFGDGGDLDGGDDPSTGIDTTVLSADRQTSALFRYENDKNRNDSVQWYTLDGYLLNGMPTRKGIYIICGRKHIIH